MRPWSNPNLVSKTPIISVLLLELANAGQLWRMWHERTSAGQSIGSWVCVNLALIAWLNFYRVCLPADRRFWAMATTVFGIVMNAAVILTAVYFRISA